VGYSYRIIKRLHSVGSNSTNVVATVALTDITSYVFNFGIQKQEQNGEGYPPPLNFEGHVTVAAFDLVCPLGNLSEILEHNRTLGLEG